MILDDNFEQNLVNDSKKLNFKTRLELDDYIKNNVKDLLCSVVENGLSDKKLFNFYKTKKKWGYRCIYSKNYK